MAEETRALGYICPECGKPVYGERTRFALNAAAVGLVCGCGRSELTAEHGSTQPVRKQHQFSAQKGHEKDCTDEHQQDKQQAQPHDYRISGK